MNIGKKISKLISGNKAASISEEDVAKLASSGTYLRALALWGDSDVVAQRTVDDYVAGLLDEPEVERLLNRANADPDLKSRIEKARYEFEAPIPSEVIEHIDSVIISLNVPSDSSTVEVVAKGKPRGSRIGLLFGSSPAFARGVESEQTVEEEK
jgi:hypothetical protein